MKQTALMILIAISITSCYNKQTKTADNNVVKSDSIKKPINEIIRGVWVVSDYIVDIQKTKSPYQSKDKLNGIVSLLIDGKVKGDSMVVSVNWNNHMGSDISAYLTNNHKPNSLRTNIKDYPINDNTFEIGYELIDKDTLLFLYHYSSTNNLLDKRQFEKVLEKRADVDVGCGLHFIVNKILFAGNYILIDSTKTESNVHLDYDGSMTGFPNFNNYYIMTDFVCIGENDRDQIILDLYTKNQKDYAYTRIGDTINIYKTILSEDHIHLLLDKLKFRLIRQK